MAATQTVGWIRSHGRKATGFALFALVLLTALAVASSSKAAVESPPPPSVWSDKADYAPGELVTLSGANWAPGEAVHIRVNDDAGETWRRDVDVTADESGAISDQFNLPNWFVSTYSVAATGTSSGTATWSFTDADNTTTTLTSSLNPSNLNDSVTFTAKVKRTALNTAVTVGSVRFGTGANCGGGFTQLQAGQTPNSSGEVTYMTSALPAGATTIRACYNGTGGSSGTQDSTATLTQTVNAKQNQTITFDAPTGTTYGDADFDPGATADSGLAVSYSSSTASVCTIVAANIHVVAAGSCTVTASQAGNTNYYAAPDVTRTFSIDKADADCSSIAGYSVTYNASAHTATGTCEGVGTDGTLAGLDLSGTTHTNAGDYSGDPWTFTDVSGNYNDTSGTVDDFIGKADADCAISGYDDVYDGQAHGASGSCAGVEDEVLAGLDLGDTFTNVPGGTAEWAFTDVTGNYNDESGSVEIVISKAELTVKADNKAKDYDGSAFTAFTRTITGFASGEGESVVTGSVTYGGTAVGAVNAGSYTIVPDVSGLSADNYTFAASNGTLTIHKVTLTVKADNKSKVFDGSPFTAFTRTITGFVNSESESVISGSVTYAGTAVGATAVGTYTITPVVSGLSATNYNFTPVNGTLTIGAWNAQGYGFYQPVGVANSIFTAAPTVAPSVNPGELWNTAKGGSTIPLKFNVYAGPVEKTSLSDISSFQSQKLSCSGGVGEDPLEITTTGSTSLRYDGTAGQWIQNWKTPTANMETCYRAWVTFADGSSIEAFFKLKK
jgi:MBG domain (YGX type)